MLKYKYIDYICITIFSIAILLTCVFISGEKLGIKKSTSAPGYETRIFDDSYVHDINLEVDDWDTFIDTALDEEYIPCNISIDGEEFKNVGLRVKGNNSKSLIKKYGHERYSLKLEFDHYNDGGNYYGLDKLNLDCAFQDNSYLKNYITYDMMCSMDVPAPLCSYVWVKINNRDFGLFLAIEEPEEAFAERVYGKNHGLLYKPDYKDVYANNTDVYLQYTNEEFENYDNIFRKAKFKVSDEDKRRLIDSLKLLSRGRDLDSAINIDEVLRYFTVQVFAVNLDSYLGPTGHNYFLYEEDGIISILPWDYNLAYCTYSLGMPEPVNDAELYVNYPIDTPAWKDVMLNRPLFHNLMLNDEYHKMYHVYFNEFISSYFENGYFDLKVERTVRMISPYVKKDPTAFCSYEDFLFGVKTFQTFCNLRAESIRKQLEGTVPSTIKGQSLDNSNFVDASSIWLPDLGEIADLKD